MVRIGLNDFLGHGIDPIDPGHDAAIADRISSGHAAHIPGKKRKGALLTKSFFQSRPPLKQEGMRLQLTTIRAERNAKRSCEYPHRRKTNQSDTEKKLSCETAHFALIAVKMVCDLDSPKIFVALADRIAQAGAAQKTVWANPPASPLDPTSGSSMDSALIIPQ